MATQNAWSSVGELPERPRLMLSELPLLSPSGCTAISRSPVSFAPVLYSMITDTVYGPGASPVVSHAGSLSVNSTSGVILGGVTFHAKLFTASSRLGSARSRTMVPAMTGSGKT